MYLSNIDEYQQGYNSFHPNKPMNYCKSCLQENLNIPINNCTSDMHRGIYQAYRHWYEGINPNYRVPYK